MADWQFKLDLKDAWRKSEEDEIDTVELSKVVVERIKALSNEIRERAEKPRDIIDQMISNKLVRMADVLEDEVLPMFEEIVEAEDDDVESFDNALSYLYDWGDSSLDNRWGGKKMCWISTVI